MAICVNFGYVVPDLSTGTDKVLLVYTATDSGMAGIDTAALFGSLHFPDGWSYGGTELRQQQIPEPINRYAIIIPLDNRPNNGADFSMSVNRTTVLGESTSYQQVYSAYGPYQVTHYYTYSYSPSQPASIPVYNYDSTVIDTGIQIYGGFVDGYGNGTSEHDYMRYSDLAEELTLCMCKDGAYNIGSLVGAPESSSLAIGGSSPSSVYKLWDPVQTLWNYNGGWINATWDDGVLFAPGTRSRTLSVTPGCLLARRLQYGWNSGTGQPVRSVFSEYYLSAAQPGMVPVYNSIFITTPATNPWPAYSAITVKIHEPFYDPYYFYNPDLNWNTTNRVPFYKVPDNGDASTMSFSLQVWNGSGSWYYVTPSGARTLTPTYFTFSPGDTLVIPYNTAVQ